jgi:hypothetical protein
VFSLGCRIITGSIFPFSLCSLLDVKYHPLTGALLLGGNVKTADNDDKYHTHTLIFFYEVCSLNSRLPAFDSGRYSNSKMFKQQALGDGSS